MKNKISVIIPCYNLDSYLRKCLESLLGQTYTNLEIIAIDDGSTDETPKILDEYAAKDNRVVFIRQENSGAGEALNRGIELAKGGYIAFVDNDDWVEPTIFEKLHIALISNNADMAVCNFNLIYDDRIETCYSKTNARNETIDVYDDVYNYYCRYCACTKPNNYIWSRLYKADIIKNSDVRFENLRLGADTLFNFKLLPLMKRVAFIKDGLYNYVQRKDSSIFTSANKENIATVYADGLEVLANYYVAKGYNEFLQLLPMHAFTRLRSIFFYSRLAGMGEDEIIKNIKTGFKGRKIYDYLTGAVKL